MATAVEYGLIAAGISLVIIASISSVDKYLKSQKNTQPVVENTQKKGFVELGWKQTDGRLYATNAHLSDIHFKMSDDQPYWKRASVASECKQVQRADGRILISQYQEVGKRDDIFIAGCAAIQ